MFFPPDVYFLYRVMSSQRQLPYITMAGNVFNGGIQNQETISMMGSEVILYVLLGHPMWCERPVSKTLIGERHNDLGDVCPLLSLAAV